jgi:mannose-6-phosphate isomerase-like protein (cupin superfamily)
VIYILGGTGMVHVDERRVPISSGTSIFLPPGVSHCLENTGESPLKLLGVFSPPGAPASKQED